MSEDHGERIVQLDDRQGVSAAAYPARRGWLASLLLRRGGSGHPGDGHPGGGHPGDGHPGDGPSRFVLFYQRLRQRLAALPRHVRRQLAQQLRRKSAAALAGAALLLALGRAPALYAANINVDGVNCTLIEAIQTANSDAPVPGCVTGSGADTINLQTDVTLTASYGVYYESETGLPLITSDITIEGNGNTIERDTADPDKFRLFAVSSSGDLTLNDVTLSGGYAYLLVTTPAPYNPPTYVYTSYYGDGGAIYNNGAVTITNSSISGNEARYDGGAMYILEGTVTITDSELSGNTAERGGAIYNDLAAMTITNSVLNDNTATSSGGGAIYNDDGELTIINSTFSGNKSYDDEGGAIYNDFGILTISHSSFYENNAYDNGGGALFNFDGDVTISTSTFRANLAEYGGGIAQGGNQMTITNSEISGNEATGDGGGIDADDDDLIITNSTISDNTAGRDGGGIYNEGFLTLTNSTISGNEAGEAGGGLYNRAEDAFITNSTITGNTATSNGGGVYNFSGTAAVNFVRTLVSGNTATGGGSEVYARVASTVFGNQRNVFGHAGLTDAAAFVNFTPGGTDTKATSDGTNVPLTAILDTTLAANGGPDHGAPGLEEPMLTHALVSGSPAIDKAPSVNCTAAPTNGEDQRGFVRNVDGNGVASSVECDAGAFEYGSAAAQDLYLTAAGPGTTGDGVDFGKEDILRWNGSAWSLIFDGVDEGLTTNHDLNAIHVNDPNDLYISFFQNKIMTADVGNVFGHDILHFDGNGFSFFFDGSDVGLTTTAEKVDALHILDGSLSPVGGSCDAYLLISTLGTGKVPAPAGGMLSFQGEDILGFCLTNPGLDTQGFWHMALDGSAEGMPKNSTDSLSASDDGEIIYLTTKGAFDVDAADGSDSEVYKFESGSFSGPFFSAPANGLDEQVDGLHVVGDLP